MLWLDLGLGFTFRVWSLVFWTLALTPVFYVAPLALTIVLFLWLKLDFMFSCTAGVAAHWCKTAYSKSKKYPSARLETWEEPYLYNIQACNVKSALTENDKFLTGVRCLSVLKVSLKRFAQSIIRLPCIYGYEICLNGKTCLKKFKWRAVFYCAAHLHCPGLQYYSNCITTAVQQHLNNTQNCADAILVYPKSVPFFRGAEESCYRPFIPSETLHSHF